MIRKLLSFTFKHDASIIKALFHASNVTFRNEFSYTSLSKAYTFAPWSLNRYKIKYDAFLSVLLAHYW